MDCNKLKDDNITDDISCVRMIYQRHGFDAWVGWKAKCQNKKEHAMAILGKCDLDAKPDQREKEKVPNEKEQVPNEVFDYERLLPRKPGPKVSFPNEIDEKKQLDVNSNFVHFDFPVDPRMRQPFNPNPFNANPFYGYVQNFWPREERALYYVIVPSYY